MRLVVLSSRLIQYRIFDRNCVNPLEDELAAMPGATLVAPPALRRATVRRNRPAWLAAARTVRRADAVVWTQMHLTPAAPLWALAYVRPTAKRSLVAIDSWEPTIAYLGRLLEAQRLTHCFVVYPQAYAWLRARYPDMRLHWLPLGVNLGGFEDSGRERDIFAFWMGRRHEDLHHALEAYCAARALKYRYSLHASDPATGEELSELMNRCRYFVVTPPDINNPARTGSFSPLTSRYLEGPAAGARLLGVAPGDNELARFMPESALVECKPDGSDLAEALTRADADPAWDDIRRATRDHVRATHGWRMRAMQIYDTLRGDV
jgi:hypothetical protein